MKKKILKIATLMTAAIALVAVTVLVTVALLTSSSAVSNTFTVGDVDILMYESKVDEKGVAKADDPSINGTMKDSDGNSYHLMPGETYDKDPTVYILESSDESYLFVKVRNNISTIEEGNFVPSSGVVTTGETKATMEEQMTQKGWKKFTDTATGTVYIYVGLTEEGNLGTTAKPVGGTKTVETYDVFDTFTIHKDADVSLFGGAKVTLTAFAIQTAGFEDDPVGTENGKTAVEKAWDAIVEKYPYENGATVSE